MERGKFAQGDSRTRDTQQHHLGSGNRLILVPFEASFCREQEKQRRKAEAERLAGSAPVGST